MAAVDVYALHALGHGQPDASAIDAEADRRLGAILERLPAQLSIGIAADAVHADTEWEFGTDLAWETQLQGIHAALI
jgi:hypothetical protein